MAFTMIAVTANYDLADGTDPTGQVSFTPEVLMVNGTSVVAAPVTRQLNIDGILSITLAATTDPATNPPAVRYLVEETIAKVTRSYYVTVPHNAGSSVDLFNLTPGPS